MTALAAERTSTQVAADLEALDAWEGEHSTPARKAKRAQLERELQKVCYREVSEAKAIEEASAQYVQELAAAYAEAFAAMQAITTAIERVHMIRSREPSWAKAIGVGFALHRPEPLHVRVMRGGELRNLNARYNSAIQSRW
jgi:hypothetical protein